MMKTIILATQNKDKVKEVKQIMSDMNINIITMQEAGIDIDVVEDGETFEANAIKKAEEIMKISGQIVLADDSGLEIDYFDKAPGVYSARYLGKDTPYQEKNAIILERMKEAPESKRGARFVCAIAAAFPDKKMLDQTIVTKGIIEGRIGDQPRGSGGFGYDPIFYPEGFDTSTADISPELKNKISHRGRALEDMKIQLKRIMGN
ncbi:MAG TPA: RdgB/HAM1 family non-canonical purine NTP pyrophosphatase [Epulopiscium sp.]|nr:RdgB/HAM1 family non-canonical purine NTP pyrophosphatase [Candidatus Epulonipiscium sp.]